MKCARPNISMSDRQFTTQSIHHTCSVVLPGCRLQMSSSGLSPSPDPACHQRPCHPTRLSSLLQECPPPPPPLPALLFLPQRTEVQCLASSAKGQKASTYRHQVRFAPILDGSTLPEIMKVIRVGSLKEAIETQSMRCSAILYWSIKKVGKPVVRVGEKINDS
jgi:hypothetical protein